MKKRNRFSNREIEEALRSPEVEAAAEWLRTHPPGAKLPAHLEPGYAEEEDEPGPGYWEKGDLLCL